jgi:hypothetical protein
VLWAFAACGVVGLFLGLRFRAPAVIAASAIILVGGAVLAPLIGLPLWTALAAPLGAMCALQSGYIVGLMLWCGISRARPQLRDALSARESSADAEVRLDASRQSAAAGH